MHCRFKKYQNNTKIFNSQKALVSVHTDLKMRLR